MNQLPADTSSLPPLPAVLPLHVSGIYCVRSLRDDRRYVGQSIDIAGRWKSHLAALWACTHTNPQLQQTFNAHSEANLEFSVLESNVPHADLNARERHWTLHHSSHLPQHGFNLMLPSDHSRKTNRAAKPVRGLPAPGVDPVVTPQMTPRTAQKDAETALLSSLEIGEKTGLIRLPCGVGKTRWAAMVSRHFKRTLFITHTDTLVDQALQAFTEVYPGHQIGVIKAGEWTPDARLVVACLPTLRSRLHLLNPALYDFVVMDEAHLGGARSGSTVLRHFTPRYTAGLTATPQRENGTPLEDQYGRMIFNLGVQQAIDHGLLVPMSGVSIQLDLKVIPPEPQAGANGGKKKAARQPSQSSVLNTPAVNAEVSRQLISHCGQDRTLALCTDVRHARALAAELRAQGARAEAVCGADRDREHTLARYRRGDVQYLTTVRLAGVGFDDPPTVNAALVYRTDNQVRFSQNAGRPMRTFPGKTRAQLLDFGGNLERGMRIDSEWPFEYTLVQGAARHLPGRAATETPGVPNVEVLGVTTTTLNPVAPRTRPQPRPLRPRRMATERQVSTLNRWGYDTHDLSFHRAHEMIEDHPATPGQLRLLERLGYNALRPWGLMVACRTIDRHLQAREEGRRLRPDVGYPQPPRRTYQTPGDAPARTSPPRNRPQARPSSQRP